MNLFKKGIFAFLIAGSIISCEEDDITAPTESITGTGLTEITFSSFSATTGADESGLEDGTYVTVKPIAIGVSTFVVDFGAGSAPITFAGGSGTTASYDYPNTVSEATYTITVTAKSDQGLADVTLTENVTIEHEINSIDNTPASPSEQGRNSIYAIFTDGMEYNDAFVTFTAGTSGSGGTEVALDSGNSILEFSYLNSNSGVLELDSDIVIADAFDTGVGVNGIHFDIHSNFSVGVDVLKITLVDNNNSIEYVKDEIALSDGEWLSLDYDLSSDFSAPVVQFDEIKFEVGNGGTANEYAVISVDNIYLPRTDLTTILNGDFNGGQNFWKWGLFTDGETNPYGSSSDGSWNNYDGSDNGSKTKGAKWSSSQSGGPLRTSNSRYAYQGLNLLPNTAYTLEYQYAIKSDNSSNEPIGGRRVVGLIIDGHYLDGAEAVENIGSNLGSYVGTVANGKFSDSNRETVTINFTTNDSGEVGIMFYAVTPVDAWIDNVKVY